MNKANYQIGINDALHSGLNLEYYTHFTSPIRRYADIITHRLVKAVIQSLESPYTQVELENLCKNLNDINHRLKKFKYKYNKHQLLKQDILYGYILSCDTCSDRLTCYINKSSKSKDFSIKEALIQIKRPMDFVVTDNLYQFMVTYFINTCILPYLFLEISDAYIRVRNIKWKKS